MLTCPNCLHAFGHPPSGVQPSAPAPSIPTATTLHGSSCTLHTQPPVQMVTSPATPSATHCATSRSSSAPTGGRCSVFVRNLDEDNEDPSSNMTPADKFLPQPSPSVPLSFVLPIPAAPTLTTTSGQWPSSTTTTMVTNPPSPFLATIVPWTLPPTPSHEGSPSSWPWAASSSAVVIPAALLVPPPPTTLPSAPPTPTPVAAAAPTLNIPSPPAPSSEADLDRLASTVRALRASGWYYEGLSWQGSASVLADTSPGTFLVRDSSDPRFLFALSVQTERGPTSVRLHYSGGRFRLDAEPRLAAMMPLFDGVVRLVEHYTNEGKERGNCKSASATSVGNGKAVGNHVWVDSRGRVCAHVMLSRPRYRAPPTLQHLARLAINKGVTSAGRDPRTVVGTLPLPAVLAEYLTEYPHTL
ncbi:cytokine-inducible SH2-containing protein-like isoform X2 [Ischnura elegans]|nr:cytokine-inducible SH2-containing protein-like isoform X2 [Ischnura elegans]XP_046407820.1 cytokine-inducible SH2-containing protein-like isoform X2 [Ischnura elegans]